jgi:hypothetical protein
MAPVALKEPRQPEPVIPQARGSFLRICWNLVFSEPQYIESQTENKSLLEIIAGAECEDEVGSLAWLNELENAIREFMRGNESDICTPEADIVLAFCSASSFEKFFQRRGTADKALQQVALLDERNFREGGVQARAQKGPLTALELYEQLKKPVSHAVSESESP